MKKANTLLGDFVGVSILTAQLEHQFRQGQLPLQRFWFYIQPCKQTMEILASIAQAIDRGASTGGAVLSLLHERTVTMIGDTRAQNLCLFLTQSACAPYFEILEKWIYKGIIKDPYCEFMIEEHEALRKEKLQQEYNDAYWEQHYTICRDRIPVFLETVADKILRTGKIPQVIRECGRDPKCPHAEEILYTLKERQYVSTLNTPISMQAGSIKRYFLLEQGDFFVHLMDITTEEMKKQVDEIIPSRLESLLELALRTSQAKSDNFKDDLRVALLPYDLITQLLRISPSTIIQEIDPTEINISCLEAFSFDYVVRWPESLILSRKVGGKIYKSSQVLTIPRKSITSPQKSSQVNTRHYKSSQANALTRYQILFRHLFYCKHVERILCNLWVLNKAAKQYTLHSSRWYAAAFALRQRMLHLVQNLQYYMMFEVIEPNWQIMETKLRQVSTIDDVLDIHTDFLNMCLKDCMLTDPELLKIVSKLMLRMTETMNVEGEASFRVDTTDPKGKDKDKSESRKYRTAAKLSLVLYTFFNQGVLDVVPVRGIRTRELLIGSEEFASTIANFDSNFSTLLVSLLDQLSLFSTTDCEHNMTNIIHRLDFNGFYTEGLERVAAERRSKEYEGEAQDQAGASGSSLTSVSSLSSRARSDSAGTSHRPGSKGT
ncbi:gamma-tubulin complex component 2-like [Strongylocentrotus purpuratus]|uniref:Gamma-tubulin complex component n=1 Tax=Strongylocentrotus purpuratus TaxID=7668 RepID=A0A7M7NBI1_STRPU|nr:gamma-tubulin complex component 2-like [Strongylocentrotus purpuratus]